MDYVNLIGSIAGTLTTISFMPQVIKTYKSKSAKDLSLSMFSLFCVGIVLWLVYGFLNHDLPVIISNMVTLILSSSLLYFKLKYKD